jgi:hypothetical protein
MIARSVSVPSNVPSSIDCGTAAAQIASFCMVFAIMPHEQLAAHSGGSGAASGSFSVTEGWLPGGADGVAVGFSAHGTGAQLADQAIGTSLVQDLARLPRASQP